MESLLNIIRLADAGQPTALQAAVNAELANRIQDRIDGMSATDFSADDAIDPDEFDEYDDYDLDDDATDEDDQVYDDDDVTDED